MGAWPCWPCSATARRLLSRAMAPSRTSWITSATPPATTCSPTLAVLLSRLHAHLLDHAVTYDAGTALLHPRG